MLHAFISQVKGKSDQTNCASANSDTPKDVLEVKQDDQKLICKDDNDSQKNEEPFDIVVMSNLNADRRISENNKPIEPRPLVKDTSLEKCVNGAVLSEPYAEADDGWQPVQKPRSAGIYGQKLRQRWQTISKVTDFQNEDSISKVGHARLKNNYQAGRYFVLKKKTSDGNNADYYVAKGPSPSTKLGRRVAKAVMYRVKSVTSSVRDVVALTSNTGGELLSSSVEQIQVCAVKEAGPMPKRSSIVSLGISPSYKDVAVAPPGTIYMLQKSFSQDEVPDSPKVLELGEEANGEEQDFELMKSNAESIKLGDVQHLIADDAGNINDETVATDNKEGISLSYLGGGEISDVTCPVMPSVQSSHVDVSPMEEEGVNTRNMCISDNFDSNGNSNVTLQEMEYPEVKASVSYSSDISRDMSNKQLSASAAPFSPFPAVARIVPLPMNINHPSGPGRLPPVGLWPMNMSVHPGTPTILPNPMCSSPHHSYHSPPPTPNMMHCLPFMYPPYSQPQMLPPTTFPVNSSAFHPNHYAWQCNMTPKASDYVPGSVWSGCHPIEFSVSLPVVEPITESTLVSVTKESSDNSERSSPVPSFPVDLISGDEVKAEANLPAPDAVETLNDIAEVGSEKVRAMNTLASEYITLSDNQSQKGDAPNENAGSCDNYIQRHPCKTDDEKTFNILIRGRRNRKQILRMPMSLLKRPYTSQPFKAVCCRVIRD